MSLATKATGGTPPPGPTVAVGFADDDIEELGDRIAALKQAQAMTLAGYLESLGYPWPVEGTGQAGGVSHRTRADFGRQAGDR